MMVRCWRGEGEAEERWKIGSLMTNGPPESGSRYDRFEILDKSSSSKLPRTGRGMFSCFRRSSTFPQTLPDLEPSTPPKSEPLGAPCSKIRPRIRSGVHAFTFIGEAMDRHCRQADQDEEDLASEEPTSPVVNCMGQVRAKGEKPMERDEKEKSAASIAIRSPARVLGRSDSYKWWQPYSSSISPSHGHSDCEASCSSM